MGLHCARVCDYRVDVTFGVESDVVDLCPYRFRSPPSL
jgi:hypothetical protein